MTREPLPSAFESSPVPLVQGSDGVIRVTDAKVTLEALVLEFQGGSSAERLHEIQPSLSLETIYAVISYSLTHREQVSKYLASRLNAMPESDEDEKSGWGWPAIWGVIAIIVILSLELALVALGWCLVNTRAEQISTLFAACFGLITGLTAGVLASPLDSDEQKQFASVASVFSAFVSGFLLSKVERLFDEAVKNGRMLEANFLVLLPRRIDRPIAQGFGFVVPARGRGNTPRISSSRAGATEPKNKRAVGQYASGAAL